MARRDTVLVCLLAVLPALAALAAFGVIEATDSIGYIAYAQQIATGSVPAGAALLHEAAVPISLFRAPGYPALLAALHWVFPDAWRLATAIVQIVASAAIAGATYRVALYLGARRGAALVAALLPAVGFGVVWQISLLTDALSSACLAGAALVLVSGPRLRLAALTGVLLGIATTLREATPVLMLAYLPLAWLLGGALQTRLARMALIALPACLVIIALATWNHTRIGRFVVTTTAQTQMVYSLMPVVRHGVPVYEGPDAFDRIARETVGSGDYDAINTLHQRLFTELHMTAPEMAGAASARYARAWLRFPLPMLQATAENFRVGFLAMPFQPIDTVALLDIYSGRDTSPSFVKLDRLWAALTHGDVSATVLFALVVITRLVGTVIALAGIVLPWLPGRGWRLRGLWLLCAGMVFVYLPVHLEPRYLAPVIPLLCVMAATSLRRSPALPAA